MCSSLFFFLYCYYSFSRAGSPKLKLDMKLNVAIRKSINYLFLNFLIGEASSYFEIVQSSKREMGSDLNANCGFPVQVAYNRDAIISFLMSVATVLHTYLCVCYRDIA